MHKKLKKRDETYNLDDVLGPPPKGLSYYGSGLIFIIVILLISLAGIVKYPETVKSEIYLTSENPPRKIVSNTSSYIDSIYIKDGDFLQKDQVILGFTNNSKEDDVSWLNSNVIKVGYSHLISSNKVLINLQLGTIQKEYDGFKKSLEDYCRLKKSSIYQVQLTSVRNQIEICKNKNKQIAKNIELLDKKSRLSKKNSSTDSILNKKGYVSNVNFNEIQIKDINNGFQLNEEIKEKYEVELQIETLNQKCFELSHLLNEEMHTEQINLRIKFNALLDKFKTWQKNYVVKSVVAGIANFNNKHWVKGTYINQGEELMKITPKREGCIIAFAKIGDLGSSNVKVGQRVNIKLNNYPFKEYGMLIGYVQKVVGTPSSDNYLVHVKFPNGLVTSYGKKLEFHPQMKGVADILTKKQSLLTKIFQEIKSIMTS